MAAIEKDVEALGAAAAFLADPATHGGAPVERVSTHTADVFLAGPYAYKLKKPVKFAFLDYSTVEKREAACRAELAVNAAASDIYLGARAIRRGRDGALILDEHDASDGETVDWVVWMRRFDRDAAFDRLLEKGRIERPLIAALGDMIAAAHADAERTPSFGRPESYAEDIENFSGALQPLAPDAATRWAAGARIELRRLARRIDQRRRTGRTRRLHGDLHLGNIVLLDGSSGPRPMAFDAIEFSDRVACVDVLHDVAFTAADLIARGRGDFANVLMNRYLGVTRDYGGLILWRFFLSLRLAVRAMAARYAGDAEEARARLALADHFLIHSAAADPPRLIVVGGLSGSGKTTLARDLATRIDMPVGAVHLSSDEVRKRLFGAPPERRLPGAAYRAEVSGRVHRRLMRDARRALLAGAPVLLDATFSDPRARTAVDALAESLGLRVDKLWLDAPEALRIARIESRVGDASDVSTAIALRQRAPEDLSGWRLLDATAAPDATLDAALRVLRPTSRQRDR